MEKAELRAAIFYYFKLKNFLSRSSSILTCLLLCSGKTDILSMAEARGCEEQEYIYDSSKPTVSAVAPDYIDLTESDDFQGAFTSISPLNPVCMDESLSIVYENIKPQPELQVVDLAEDIVGQLLKESSQHHSGQISRKVRIGSKSMNVCVSISTKSKEVPSNTTSNEPEIIAVESQSAMPEEPPPIISKIECGICLDSADEISTSERKLLSTTCGHIFCNQCYEQCMKTCRSVCPKCRKRITKKQVHPLYI